MMFTDDEVSMQEDFKLNDGVSKPLSFFFCWKPDFRLCVLFNMKSICKTDLTFIREEPKNVMGGSRK